MDPMTGNRVRAKEHPGQVHYDRARAERLALDAILRRRQERMARMGLNPERATLNDGDRETVTTAPDSTLDWIITSG